MKTIVTHNGRFHADDVFSVVVLTTVFGGEEISVVRSRDDEIISKADIVVDVGLIYDPVKKRFDHHQEEGAGKRDNGIPFASFGLVWKEYGLEICGNQEIADRIDRILVSPIDAGDNGMEIEESKIENLSSFSISEIVGLFVPTWKETMVHEDKAFTKAVAWAKEVLNRIIKKETDRQSSRDLVERAYGEADDKRIVVINDSYPWKEWILNFKEPLFVVIPDSTNGNWMARAVPVSNNSFENKVSFPDGWAGKSDAELAYVSGIKDAVFCHKNLFLAIAKTKESAIKMAEIAVAENSQ